MEELKKDRKKIKSAFTRLKNRVTEYCEAIDSHTVEGFQSRLDSCILLFSRFDAVQDKIEDLMEESEIEGESQYRSEIEECYFHVVSICKSKIKDLTPQVRDNSAIQTNESADVRNTSLDILIANQTQLTSILQSLTKNKSSTPVHSHIEESMFQCKIPMPTLCIPSFSGDFKEWKAFHDIFQSIVDSNGSLTAAQKFQYLKSALRGEAASVLRHLQISDANYAEAYELLKNRYDQDRYIIESHIQTMMNCPALKYASSDTLRTLSNVFNESVRALKALDLPVNGWDCWLVYLLSSKLDRESEQLWRRHSATEKRPTFEKLNAFLDTRIYELSPIHNSQRELKPILSKTIQKNTQQIKYSNSAIAISCILCKSNHYLFACSTFQKMNHNERQQTIKNNGLCFNCLKGKHFVKECKSSSTCHKCQKRHHTMLHFESSSLATKQESSDSHFVSPSVQSLCNNITCMVPTAVVLIKDALGVYQPCRALMDTGSQVNLISESCAQRLKLKRRNARLVIGGIGGIESKENTTRGKIDIEIKSKYNSVKFETSAYILNRLTNILPNYTLNNNDIQFFNSFSELADPNFHIASKIDIVIGSDIFFRSLLSENISNNDNRLIAHKTSFGWIISGALEKKQNAISLHTLCDVDETLTRFWEIEDITTKIEYTPEDAECEDYFKNTHQRLENGQYMLRLPFKKVDTRLGNSREQALTRLHTMERRFKKDTKLSEYYNEFMKDYSRLSHMEQANNISTENVEHFYLPHHGVWKETSTTTKLRVVFDGSCVSSSGISLNQQLHKGPKIQQDLYQVLLRFRLRRIASVADIVKMYRQIMIHPDDRKYQQILWRTSETDIIQEYELKTVTYGTSCAPFLAIRTLVQLAEDDVKDYPEGAKLLLNNFYVDDLMASFDTIKAAIESANELVHLLERGRFSLHKWSSNSYTFLKNIPERFQAKVSSRDIEDNSTDVIKTLGINWIPEVDNFTFLVNIQHKTSFTKRNALSIISRIFDPHGLISPCVIQTKIFIQQLWISGVSWDDPLPDQLGERWKIL